jgi:hypothetical protein
MALQEQLSAADLALLELVEDEIWFGEFMRCTRDGSVKQDEWPTRPFEYRWYQKDLLTDQNEFIVLTAGRAVGKCHPVSSRILTVDEGYRQVGDLLQTQKRTKHFQVWSLDPKTRELVQRRAFLTPDKVTDVYLLRTECGYEVRATGNHPVLTPRGYVMVQDLSTEDEVGVPTELPPVSAKEPYSWEELRWLGYRMASPIFTINGPFHIKYQAQIEDFKRIAKAFNLNFRLFGDHVFIKRKRGPFKHYGNIFLKQNGYAYNYKGNPFRRFSAQTREISNAQMKILLESFLGYNAVVTSRTLTTDILSKGMAQDIQEFLLRFKVETRLTQLTDTGNNSRDTYRLELLDDNAYYTFFTTFNLPGVVVQGLHAPLEPVKALPFMRWDRVQEVRYLFKSNTFALTVVDTENYIADNVFVHNSLVLEDKMVHEIVNSEREFPDETKESMLVTANVAQMTPILDRLMMRFMGSRFMRGYVSQFNRSKGTLDFKGSSDANFRMNARIAGSRGEANMVM